MKCWWADTEEQELEGAKSQEPSQGWEGGGTQRPRLKKHIRTKEAVLCPDGRQGCKGGCEGRYA